VCLNLRLTDGYESSIEEMWRMSDLVERLIFVGLALMLVYTLFATIRFFRRYFLACREVPSLDFTPAPGVKKNVIAELNRGVGALRSIASAAPLLGLAGASYGILLAFFGGYSGSKASVIAAISAEFSATLVATGAGLIVALPAAISYNVLRTCLEKFESSRSSMLLEATPRSYGFAQTLPLRSRFSAMPPYALIAAPILAILLQLFAAYERYQAPTGLSVYIAVSEIPSIPIVISVIGGSAGIPSPVYVNSKETPWNELDGTLRRQLNVRTRRVVSVEAEAGASWQDVLNAIDVAHGLEADVLLLTTAPRIGSSRSPKEKANRKLKAK
jgi:hypothetical protein